MKVVRCDHGHWYDADTYTRCPHCNPSTGKIAPSSDSSVRKVTPQDLVDTVHSEVEDGPIAVHSTGANDGDDPAKKGKKTFSAFSQGGASAHNEPRTEVPEEIPDDTPVSESESDSQSDLRRELQGVSNSSVQKTMSYFGKKTQAMESQDGGHKAPQNISTAPVVGWLVCIAGPHIGQSFNIIAGKNSIGRGPDNDIVLSNDPAVSGNRHAWVTYEAKHRNFILQAGDGRYPDLNGEQVIEGKMLKSFDKIELGETMLLFVNLCGENFAWEDYLNKE